VAASGASRDAGNARDGNDATYGLVRVFVGTGMARHPLMDDPETSHSF